MYVLIIESEHFIINVSINLVIESLGDYNKIIKYFDKTVAAFGM